MPSSDTLATVVLVAVALLSVWGICRTEPGGAVRALGGEHTGRHVRPAGSPRERHAPPLHSHAAPRGGPVLAICAPAEPPASGPVEPDTLPWVRPDVPATIPDALTNMRTPA